MQTPMLVATEILAFGSNALAPGQMHAAVNAAHHILAFECCRALSCFLLPLFQRPPVAGYQPQEEHGNKNKEQDSTQGVTSFAVLQRDVNNV
jgi:hypothetical protein